VSVVADEQTRVELTTDLDGLLREGARGMLAVALEAEVEAYIVAHTATLVELIAQAHRGIHRIRCTPHLAYSFVRHTGLSAS
jgi:hypothetical protein